LAESKIEEIPNEKDKELADIFNSLPALIKRRSSKQPKETKEEIK